MPPRDALRAGDRSWPGYEVLGHLARSHSLDVYDAWSDERACRCVIKTPMPDRRGTTRTVRALTREGRLLGRLSHPHIVRSYATLREPWPAVVLETLTGETLAHLIHRRERRLGAVELAHLGLHLCSATAYLHAHGILHLDLKPGNVVADAGRAKVIDLSIARSGGRHRPGVGTWCYLAPEQGRGDELGPAADVWGIGGVLWEAAAGISAFGDDHEDDDGVEHPCLARRAEPVGRHRRLPVALARAIDACLEPAGTDRPTVGALTRALAPVARVPRRVARLAARGSVPASSAPTGLATPEGAPRRSRPAGRG